jgi:hypothetical protein
VVTGAAVGGPLGAGVPTHPARQKATTNAGMRPLILIARRLTGWDSARASP